MSRVAVLLLCSSLALVAGFQTGAPSGACDDMFPQHNTPGQNTSSPYKIHIHKLRIKPGESTDVTISGIKGQPFKGFILQARVGSTAIGQFSKIPKEAKFMDCGTGKQNSVTHSSPAEKNSITVTWTSPKNIKEQVIFYATVAKNGGEFWVQQKSRAVNVS